MAHSECRQLAFDKHIYHMKFIIHIYIYTSFYQYISVYTYYIPFA